MALGTVLLKKVASSYETKYSYSYWKNILFVKFIMGGLLSKKTDTITKYCVH